MKFLYIKCRLCRLKKARGLKTYATQTMNCTAGRLNKQVSLPLQTCNVLQWRKKKNTKQKISNACFILCFCRELDWGRNGAH